jgi:lipoate-protein ligase A
MAGGGGRDAGLAVGRWRHDEAMCARVREGRPAECRVYRLDETAVVLGSGSDAARELHVEACRHDQVPVLRRRGGGCSVVVDPGNVVLSLALPVEGLGGIRTYFRWISSWLIAELSDLGLPDVERRGVSDLVLDDRKIAGSCVHREKRLLYYSVTILVDGDVGKIERYLQHPPREPDYRSGRHHRDFVRPLSEFPGGWTAHRLEEALAAVARPDRLARHPADASPPTSS